MSTNETLIEIGEIYHSTTGTAERWAYLYFDTDACEFVVIESSDNISMYPSPYSPSGRGPDVRATLRDFVQRQRWCRDKVIGLVTEKLHRP